MNAITSAQKEESWLEFLRDVFLDATSRVVPCRMGPRSCISCLLCCEVCGFQIYGHSVLNNRTFGAKELNHKFAPFVNGHIADLCAPNCISLF